jgi:ketosteroid isomerase-like protein
LRFTRTRKRLPNRIGVAAEEQFDMEELSQLIWPITAINAWNRSRSPPACSPANTSPTRREATVAAENEQATTPEDLTRLFVERANTGDADGLAALYEPDAILAYPPGKITCGRDAIRAVYQQMPKGLTFLPEQPRGDIALTATHRRDGAGIRVQVARRQPNGSWLRMIDQPEPPQP